MILLIFNIYIYSLIKMLFDINYIKYLNIINPKSLQYITLLIDSYNSIYERCITSIVSNKKPIN